MRARSAFTLLAAVLLAASFARSAHAQLKLPRVSPAAIVTQTIGIPDLSVSYSRPGVKNRVIWGDLVPYDKVWRTGANEATQFTTSDSIQFGGKPLAAGSYELFTLPGKDQWQVILSSQKGEWGAFTYDSTKDAARITVKPTAAEPQEWMAFSFEDLTPTSANLVLRWEKLRIAVPIAVEVNGRVLAAARAAIAGMKSDDWRTPYQAAGFCFNNDVALEEGKGWLEKSLAILQNYNNLFLLARWQMKLGKKDDAIKTAGKAMEAAKASKDKVDTSPLEKAVAEWTGKKS